MVMNVLLVIPKFGDVENTEAFIPIGTAYINAAIRRAAPAQSAHADARDAARPARCGNPAHSC